MRSRSLAIVLVLAVARITRAACGDGVLDPGETCDDGNLLDGDCCSHQCVAAEAGTTCDLDNDACSADVCDGAGSCTAGSCSACCDAGMGCTPSPQAGCIRPVLSKSVVTLRRLYGDPARNVAKWKLAKGGATTFADFGTPATTTGYTLCVYRGDEVNPGLQRLLLASEAPAGGTCGTTPCWQALPGAASGYKYRDRLATPGGIGKITLRAGDDGRAKLVVTAKGENLHFPQPLSFGPPPTAVTTQLKASNGTCWQTLHQPPLELDNGSDLRGRRGSPSGAFVDHR